MSNAHRTRAIRFVLIATLLGNLPWTIAEAQPAAESASGNAQPPVIADEPKTIDPATLVPPALAKKITVRFDDTPLRNYAKQIEQSVGIPILLEETSLAEEGLRLSDVVTDHSVDAPAYLILNRLASMGLTWIVRDNVLHVTSESKAEEVLTTESYNLADLLDAGCTMNALTDAIQSGTSGPWLDIDGTGGSMQWLGDVNLVRQTAKVHREIAGLLAALRDHGRRTYTLDPPEHIPLRDKLQQNVSVTFDRVTLSEAMAELSQQSGADIRLDSEALKEEGLRERELVSLTLADRSLDAVLRVLLEEFGLAWVLEDGVLLVTTKTKAGEIHKAAVYDVRDLCRDNSESDALAAAVISQTHGPWFEVDGTGGKLSFAKSGTMVIRQTEDNHNQILRLLDMYRQALRASKRRDRSDKGENEVIIRYYRMDAAMADDLLERLPTLIEPDSWKSDAKPNVPGEIQKIASAPELVVGATGGLGMDSKPTANPAVQPVLLEKAVLVVRQTHRAHKEIGKVINRTRTGDSHIMDLLPVTGGGGGLGGGGFGGGFFSLQPTE